MTPPKKVKYKRVKVGDRETVTATYQGEILGPIDSTHPKWDKILELLKADDVAVVKLFQPIKDIALGFRELSDRLVVRDRLIYWDGDPQDNSLTEQIIRFLEEGLDFQPLVNFYDKISQNPSKNSQDLLFNWLRTHRFTITPEGDILGFKGYRVRDGGTLESTTAGTASVNGVEYKNQVIPCKVGDTVTMPRSQVDDNPLSPCSVGLHIGTPGYSRKFGNTRAAVLINPRDVVSVPKGEADKMRVCRYYVLGLQDHDEVSALKKNAPQWETTAPKPEPPRAPAPKPDAPRGTSTQPKSDVLEDEKKVARPAPKSKPKTTTRAKPAQTRPKATPKKAAPKVAPKTAPKAAPKATGRLAPKQSRVTETLPAHPVKTNWTEKAIDKLLACTNDKQMKEAFPNTTLATLKRKASEERKKRATDLPPPTV